MGTRSINYSNVYIKIRSFLLSLHFDVTIGSRYRVSVPKKNTEYNISESAKFAERWYAEWYGELTYAFNYCIIH